MIDWLRRRLARRAAKNPVAFEASPRPSARVVFWAPAYDTFTSETSKWLVEISRTPDNGADSCIAGATICRHDVEETLGRHNELTDVAILCGHGTEDALLGPPVGDEIVVDDTRHSILYSVDMVGLGPRNLFAFCCMSGTVLGLAFSTVPGRRFLGFVGKIPLNITNEECIDTWKSIVQKTAIQIALEGTLTKSVEKALRQRYDLAYSYYSNGPGRNNDQALMMCAQLLRHRKLLRLYGGE
jgi:hypothetical protein